MFPSKGAFKNVLNMCIKYLRLLLPYKEFCNWAFLDLQILNSQTEYLVYLVFYNTIPWVSNISL